MSAPALIVGYRFHHGTTVRPGMNSIVLEAEPIAGPIYRCEGTVYKGIVPRQVWEAHCRGCGAVSKDYLRRGERALLKWAHAHRCNVRLGVPVR